VKLTKQTSSGVPLVQSYRQGGFKVGGAPFQGSIIVLPTQTLAWPVTDIHQITAESLAPVFAAVKDLDLCLIGSGPGMVPLPTPLKAAFKEAGLAFDVMQTGSACRSYNLLVGEGRAVAAAFIAV